MKLKDSLKFRAHYLADKAKDFVPRWNPKTRKALGLALGGTGIGVAPALAEDYAKEIPALIQQARDCYGDYFSKPAENFSVKRWGFGVEKRDDFPTAYRFETPEGLGYEEGGDGYNPNQKGPNEQTVRYRSDAEIEELEKQTKKHVEVIDIQNWRKTPKTMVEKGNAFLKRSLELLLEKCPCVK